MIMSLRNLVIQLAEGKKLAFRGARDVRLECTEGRVWLTIEGQSDDFLLSKGERLRIEGDGLAPIQGLPSGSVQLASMAHGQHVEKVDSSGLPIYAKCV
ncbi:MAG: DUF2917 domain-containing protein [Gallionella sp.]